MKKYALQTQLDSRSIVQSFSDILRRVPNDSAVREFEVFHDRVIKRKKLLLDSPFFLENLCWSAVLYPSKSNSQSYNLKLYHHYVSDVFDLRISYSGYFELKRFVNGCWANPCTSHIEGGIGFFKDFLLEEMFTESEDFHLKFRVKLFLTQPPITHASFFQNDCMEYLVERWNEDGDFKLHWYENRLLSEQEMDLPLHEALTKYLSQLIAEDNLRRCCADDWMKVLHFFVHAVAESRSPWTYISFCRAGVFKLIAKLFAADLSQLSSIPVISALHMLLTDQMFKQPVTSNSVIQSQICEAFDIAFINIVKKFSDPRYPIEVLSVFSLRMLPQIACYRSKRLDEGNMLHSKMFLAVFENAQHFLPFLNYQSVLSLAEMDRGTLYSEIDNSCVFFDTIAQIYLMQFIATAGSVQIPVTAEKVLLEMICENLNNPFYPVKDRHFSVCTLHRIISCIKPTLMNWCLRNQNKKPFLMFPTTMEAGLNLLDMVAVELTEEDPARNMLIEGYEDFFLFLRVCCNSIQAKEPYRPIDDVPSVEAVKASANVLHQNGCYEKALEMYTCTIVTSEAFARRLGKKRNPDQSKMFYYIDLANMCHNNRAGSFMESKQLQYALADVVFTINEIQSLIAGDHLLVPGYKPSVSELKKLKERLVKAKYKRLKLVARLSLWIPALRNSLDLLENHRDRPHETLKLYYHSLLKYSATIDKIQYPPFCIICHAEKEKTERSTLHMYDQTKMKCKKCRHSFCSVECYRKDTVHKSYCSKLVKLRG